MKFLHPIYLPFALTVTLFLAVANHNGWSFVKSMPWNAGRHPAHGTLHK